MTLKFDLYFLHLLGMILIYIPKETNRTRYIFRLLLRDIEGVEYQFTQDEKEFLDRTGPKFSYAEEPLGNELFFQANSILFERGIESKDPAVFNYKDCPALFPVISKRSALPFDPFAASFYMVSRYEEYLPYVRDEFSRFTAPRSLAFDKKFLEVPVVNHWAAMITDLLSKRFKSFQPPEKKFSFTPTIDIDAAWEYRARGLVRTMGGYARAAMSGDLAAVAERTKVLLGVRKDPFNTYSEQLEITAKYDLRPVYFVLIGDYGLNDKNIHYQNKAFHVLIKYLGDYAELGIHSSFTSSFQQDRLRREIKRLSGIVNKEISSSRQHFLRLNLPVTYRHFIDAGITDDYSMGYNTHIGFRAGISTPFYFYDLDLDAPTGLRIHPFAFAISPIHNRNEEMVLGQVKKVIYNVKKVKGNLHGLWTNASLSPGKHTADWKAMFEKILYWATTEL